MYSTRIEWETLRVLDSSTLVAGYNPLGGPLIHPSIKLKLVNNSNTLVLVSKDGINDIDVAPGNSFFLYDEFVTPNHEVVPAGTQILVKGAAGLGSIYLVSQYLIVL